MNRYSSHSPMTDPHQYAPLLFDLPRDIAALVNIVQNLGVHIFWAQRYGIELSEERKAEVRLRYMFQKLARLQALNPRPLWEPRPLEDRLVCNCRDFSLIFTCLLRELGIHSRVRCGYAMYFVPNHFEAHWISEYWHARELRWVQVDTQLDTLQRETLGIDFDPLDLPAGKFISGGEAWRLCRQGQADANTFGIFELSGPGFVRGDAVRDFLALIKMEVLPWDFWGLLLQDIENCNPQDLALIDQMADMAVKMGPDGPQTLQQFYECTTQLQLPADWLTTV